MCPLAVVSNEGLSLWSVNLFLLTPLKRGLREKVKRWHGLVIDGSVCKK